jgi:hypothetical protein
MGVQKAGQVEKRFLQAFRVAPGRCAVQLQPTVLNAAACFSNTKHEVTWVDCCVCLDHILDWPSADGCNLTPRAADNAGCESVVKPKGVANGKQLQTRAEQEHKSRLIWSLETPVVSVWSSPKGLPIANSCKHRQNKHTAAGWSGR